MVGCVNQLCSSVFSYCCNNTSSVVSVDYQDQDVDDQRELNFFNEEVSVLYFT